jgi:hypothetical protein
MLSFAEAIETPQLFEENRRLPVPFTLVLPLLLFDPEVLLKLADPVQIRAHTIEHLAALAKNFLDVGMSRRRLRFVVRIHSNAS